MSSFCHGRRSVQVSSVVFLLSILFLSGLTMASEPSKSTAETKSSSAGTTVVIVCVGILAVIGFCVFLFKLWQKKKREEQHARLLKLFEDDDELEVELGIRD